jgi:hypothetical protein
VDPTGVDPTGVEPTGVDPTGVEPTGAEFVDPRRTSQALGTVEIGTWSIPAPALEGVTFTLRFDSSGGALTCVPQLGNEFRDGAPKRQLNLIRPVGVGREDVEGLPAEIADESDLRAVGRPGGIGVEDRRLSELCWFVPSAFARNTDSPPPQVGDSASPKGRSGC